MTVVMMIGLLMQALRELIYKRAGRKWQDSRGYTPANVYSYEDHIIPHQSSLYRRFKLLLPTLAKSETASNDTAIETSQLLRCPHKRR